MDPYSKEEDALLSGLERAERADTGEDGHAFNRQRMGTCLEPMHSALVVLS